VAGRKNRLTSHPHVALTPMDFSDGPPTPSSICAIKHKGGLSRRRCVVRLHVYGAKFWVGKFFDALKEVGMYQIYQSGDLLISRLFGQCQTKPPDKIESRASHPLASDPGGGDGEASHTGGGEEGSG